MDLRHQRCTLQRIAKALHAPLSTLGRIMKRLGLGRLKNLEPKKLVVRPTGSDFWTKSGAASL